MNPRHPDLHKDLDDALNQAVCDAHARFAATHPASHQLFDRHAQVMPGANSRSTLFHTPYPLTMVSGHGATVQDADGHTYADFIAEYTAGVYGHSAPEIREAVADAMVRGINLCGHNLLEGQLARLVCERFAWVEQVRFTNSGTEANLMALTAAINFTGRRRIAVFNGAYHGGVLTFGATPLPTTAPYDFVVLDYNDAEQARTRLRAEGERLAAVLVEPMLGAGGCIPGDPAFLQALREETQAAGALLIFDEVMTSRLAAHGLQGRLGIRPDLTTLGKYLGGGLSFGAFGGRSDVMALFDPRRGRLAHSGTFNNNVVTMAAGIAGLTRLYTPQAAEALSARGEALRQRLNTLCAAEGVALQYTGIGSVMNAHFVATPIRRPADAASAVPLRDAQRKELLFHHLLEQGIQTAARGLVALSLPLTDADLDRMVAAVASFIHRHRSLLDPR